MGVGGDRDMEGIGGPATGSLIAIVNSQPVSDPVIRHALIADVLEGNGDGRVGYSLDTAVDRVVRILRTAGNRVALPSTPKWFSQAKPLPDPIIGNGDRPPVERVKSNGEGPRVSGGSQLGPDAVKGCGTLHGSEG